MSEAELSAKEALARKRETRKQRILRNSQDRMNRLKGLQPMTEQLDEANCNVVNNEPESAAPKSTQTMTTQSSTQPPTEQAVEQKTHTTNPLVMLLSYQPPTNIVSLKMTVVTLLAVILPLHNHRHLFGTREVSLVTAFLGLEGQYVLAAYSLGWLASCTSTSQVSSHSGLVTSMAYFLHLPTVLVAIGYCVCTLVMQIVLDFLWFLFVVVCTLTVSIL